MARQRVLSDEFFPNQQIREGRMQIWAQLRGNCFLTLVLIAVQCCPSQATPGELSLLEETRRTLGSFAMELSRETMSSFQNILSTLRCYVSPPRAGPTITKTEYMILVNMCPNVLGQFLLYVDHSSISYELWQRPGTPHCNFWLLLHLQKTSELPGMMNSHSFENYGQHSGCMIGQSLQHTTIP